MKKLLFKLIPLLLLALLLLWNGNQKAKVQRDTVDDPILYAPYQAQDSLGQYREARVLYMIQAARIQTYITYGGTRLPSHEEQPVFLAYLEDGGTAAILLSDQDIETYSPYIYAEDAELTFPDTPIAIRGITTEMPNRGGSLPSTWEEWAIEDYLLSEVEKHTLLDATVHTPTHIRRVPDYFTLGEMEILVEIGVSVLAVFVCRDVVNLLRKRRKKTEVPSVRQFEPTLPPSGEIRPGTLLLGRYRAQAAPEKDAICSCIPVSEAGESFRLLRYDDSVPIQLKEMLLISHSLRVGAAHPDIASAREICESGSELLIVLPQISGPSLRQIVEETGPVNPNTAVRWVLQLCDIVESLHRKRPAWCCGELHPENIVLRENGRLCLAELPLLHIGFGEEKEKYPYAADIAFLGYLLRYLLTGAEIPQAPYAVEELIPGAAAVSKELQRILSCCLSANEAERYYSCDLLRKDLKACLAEEGMGE